jgi:predicted nucleotidyltransferase
MISPLEFPTAQHREVADLAANFFSSQGSVDTVLVVNSCARGRAVAGSDLDMAVLIVPTDTASGTSVVRRRDRAGKMGVFMRGVARALV